MNQQRHLAADNQTIRGIGSIFFFQLSMAFQRVQRPAKSHRNWVKMFQFSCFFLLLFVILYYYYYLWVSVLVISSRKRRQEKDVRVKLLSHRRRKKAIPFRNYRVKCTSKQGTATSQRWINSIQFNRQANRSRNSTEIKKKWKFRRNSTKVSTRWNFPRDSMSKSSIELLAG